MIHYGRAKYMSKKPRKIVIMGYSGSGKSTLATKLADKYQIEVLHLDQVHWLPNWGERQAEDEQQICKSFMDIKDAWIIDGNYTKLEFQRRLEEADLIILLLYGRIPCALRVIKRWLTYKGKTRPDMGTDCPEKFDWKFLRWILWDGRVASQRNVYQDITKNMKGKTLVICNQRDLYECFDWL